MLKNNIFTIDVEDWYQGLGIPINKWNKYEHRIEIGMDILLNLMHQYNVKSTCFILGKTAEDHPYLVEKIKSFGHEIATHGYAHELVYKLSQKEFIRDFKKSIKILSSQSQDKIIGYRAPFFSIKKHCFWIFDILNDFGIIYDSSIHPIINWRYGIPSAKTYPHLISTSNNSKILEIPVSTIQTRFFNIPCGGGAYFRIYPQFLINHLMNYVVKNNLNLSLYIHPWELDVEHPKIKLPYRISATHYHNLKTTHDKLKQVFSTYSFYSIKESIDFDNL